MYIWKIKKLEEDLVAGSLPESESIKYLLANVILLSLATIPFGNENSYDIWNAVIASIVSVIGVLLVYRVNGGRNGKHILERYLSVCWVVTVRLFVLFLIPALVAMMFVQEMYLGGIPAETNEIHVLLTIISEIVFYVWFVIHIKRIADQSKVEAQ